MAQTSQREVRLSVMLMQVGADLPEPGNLFGIGLWCTAPHPLEHHPGSQAGHKQKQKGVGKLCPCHLPQACL